MDPFAIAANGFLNANSCGYLVLEAYAGLGKTAFLAWLVKERNYVHHFVELAPGQEGIERGLRNLAAQLLASSYILNQPLPDFSRSSSMSFFVMMSLRH